MKTQTFPLLNSRSLDPLINRIGDARLVLLGEASHGTHEYYTWRSAITKRLIVEKKFNFIAVEGDWPDCYRVNRYIKGFDNQDKSPEFILRSFNRWPTWMWANWEMVSLISWLKVYNSKQSYQNKVGFYGLDVYSLWESMEAILEYLKTNDPTTAKMAKKAIDCFTGFEKNEHEYAAHSLTSSCREEVVSLLKEIRIRAAMYNHDPEAALNSTQNAHIMVEAEKYYHNMMAFDERTWNIRDRHMMDTLDRLIDFYGKNAKGMVWAHNTHIGDARYTDMFKQGMFNIGQLAREKYSEKDSVLVGFGSYSGSVMAGRSWGGLMQEMEVPEALIGSVEQMMHSEFAENRLYLMDSTYVKNDFNRVLPHRAIGVVYYPENEKHNYVPSHFSRRYDAFLFIDQTKALHPLHIKTDVGQVPETYPFEF